MAAALHPADGVDLDAKYVSQLRLGQLQRQAALLDLLAELDGKVIMVLSHASPTRLCPRWTIDHIGADAAGQVAFLCCPINDVPKPIPGIVADFDEQIPQIWFVPRL